MIKKIFKGKNALIKAFSISILNQIISSGSSFALGIYLVNVFSTQLFGTYGVIFAIILVYANIVNSMLTIQMVAHFPQNEKSEQLIFAKKVLRLIILFHIISLILVLLSSLIISTYFGDYGKITEYSLLISIAALSITIKEFFVRLAYSLRKEHYALLVNVIILALIIIMITAERVIYNTMSLQKIILILAVSNITGGIIGFYVLQFPEIKKLRYTLRKDFREIWNKGGKWSTIYSVVYNLRAQTYIIITASSIGTVGVGVLNASRLLITPIIMLSPAISQIMVPRLVTKENTRTGSSLQYGILISIFQSIMVLVYLLILLVIFELVTKTVLPVDFPDIKNLTIAWGVYAMALAFRNGMEITLVSQKKFKIQMKIAMLTFPISLLLTYFSVSHSLELLIYALLLTEIIHILVIIIYFYKTHTLKGSMYQ